MLQLDQYNVIEYLIRRGYPSDKSRYAAQALAWGVSNVVLRIDIDDATSLVLKQSRGKLRTQADWYSRLDRIYREADVLNVLRPLLPAGAVPRVEFEDRENYVFAMQAVSAEHVVWKQTLLEGTADSRIAGQLGEYLGTIHARTAGSSDLHLRLGDTTVFDELRLDPFYRYLHGPHPDLRTRVDALIDETLHTSCCLVLADFSPKNILVTRDGLTLVDFETGHYGDPAFDLGFFLSHLVLKTLLHESRRDEFLQLITTFWDRYVVTLRSGDEKLQPDRELQRRAIAHLGGCVLARVDGKSPVDYLSGPLRERARQLGREWLLAAPVELRDAFAALGTPGGRGSQTTCNAHKRGDC